MGWVLALAAAACGHAATQVADGGAVVDGRLAGEDSCLCAPPDARPLPDAPPGSGHIAYRENGGDLYLRGVALADTPRDLTSELDVLSAGTDDWVNVSPDGAWLVFSLTRLGCDYSCLAAAPASDLSLLHLANAGGSFTHPTGHAAIASGGGTIVYPSNGGTHAGDLYVTRSTDGFTWSAPVELTTSSTEAYAIYPAISSDGTKVLFDCGPDPYGQAGTGVCEIGLDGNGFRKVVAPTDNGGSSANECHHPAYGHAAGSVVFEADWAGEQIYALPPIGLVSPSAHNDNSPCVLPDGRIVSLWLDRPGGPGYHELKIMDADGSNPIDLTPGLDVADIGIGCGL
jgi:Tol biopolymer transport system component